MCLGQRDGPPRETLDAAGAPGTTLRGGGAEACSSGFGRTGSLGRWRCGSPQPACSTPASVGATGAAIYMTPNVDPRSLSTTMPGDRAVFQLQDGDTMTTLMCSTASGRQMSADPVGRQPTLRIPVHPDTWLTSRQVRCSDGGLIVDSQEASGSASRLDVTPPAGAARVRTPPELVKVQQLNPGLRLRRRADKRHPRRRAHDRRRAGAAPVSNSGSAITRYAIRRRSSSLLQRSRDPFRCVGPPA